MPHTPLPPFAAWAGPRSARVVFVGEAFGEHEAAARAPFVGSSGKELWRMLGASAPELAPQAHAEVCRYQQYGEAVWVKKRGSWMEEASIAFTNSFAFRPRGNFLPSLCLQKKEADKLAGGAYPYEPLATGQVSGGRYLDPQYFGEIDRLWQELEACRPNLVVPLGNTACWALLGTTKISALRGTTCSSRVEWQGRPVPALKCLPTYHPASIIYNWSQRPVALADLGKAWLEGRTAELTRPKRQVTIWPSLAECQEFLRYVEDLRPALMGCDIETKQGQITTISFAPRPDVSFVIPFWDQRKPGWSYWSTLQEEMAAWSIVGELLRWPLVGQNFMYDLQYLMPMGLAPQLRNDTMLLHHALFPELPKSLGFLGSVYSREPAWKLMRKIRADDRTVKKDD